MDGKSCDPLEAISPADYLRADVICGLFNAINRAVFDDDHHSRFTLFLPSRSQPNRIVPWCRFYKGCADPFIEASVSKASYLRGEGYTGKAWEDPGTFIASLFPGFSSRDEFKQYYVSRLRMPANVVDDISDYMVGVRTIMTQGFIDCYGRITGVLSIDVQRLLGELHVPETRIGKGRTQESHGPEVEQLRSSVAVLYTVLESLHMGDRR